MTSGVYLLGNAEKYDRDADNMNAAYDTQSSLSSRMASDPSRSPP